MDTYKKLKEWNKSKLRNVNNQNKTGDILHYFYNAYKLQNAIHL